MAGFIPMVGMTLRGMLRDKLLHAVLGVALFGLLMVPVFSSFSMRQVQELAVTLALSGTSAILLVLSLLVGASSIWRDVDRRYTGAILTLPVSRGTYVAAKFTAIALFIALAGALLALVAVPAIMLASAKYPSDVPIHWGVFFLAVAADIFKYILLTAVALLFSSVSTSFFFPFFATLAIYFAGSASQEVFEFVSGTFGKEIGPGAVAAIKAVYYVLPNFSAFNLKVYAIYGLKIPHQGLALTAVYFCVYTAIVLTASILVFRRRQLP